MPTVSLYDLQNRVLDALDHNDVFYPRYLITATLNEAIRRLQLLTGFKCITVPVPGATVAGQLIYRTPTEITVPLRCYFEERELDKASLRQISNRFRSWHTDTNLTRGPVTRWAPIDIRQFIIHPMDALGGQLLEINGIAKITPLVEQTDVIQLDDQYADLIIDDARTRIMLREGSRAWELSSAFRQEYIRKVKTMMMFESVTFRPYFLIREEESDEGKAA